MTLDDFLGSLENSWLGAAISGSVRPFPAIETVHVLALSLVFGTILMVDLRLLGFATRRVRLSHLAHELLPYTWCGYGVAALTGSLMFISRAQTYFYDVQFRLKFVCMALAGLNMLVFHFGAYRRVLEWDDAQPPPRAARVAGGISLLCWLGVVSFGRWTGFTI